MQHLKQYFKSEKCKSYRPIPFWSWNDKLEPEELIRQIQWMNKNGMGGFFMHVVEVKQNDQYEKAAIWPAAAKEFLRIEKGKSAKNILLNGETLKSTQQSVRRLL